MPPWTRYLAPFAAGVAVGVVLHKYWPQIRELGGPGLEKAVKRGSDLVERGREQLWEKSEKFADLIAEIREEEQQKKAGPSPVPPPPET